MLSALGQKQQRESSSNCIQKRELLTSRKMAVVKKKKISPRFVVQMLEYTNVRKGRKVGPQTQKESNSRIKVHGESEERDFHDEGGGGRDTLSLNPDSLSGRKGSGNLQVHNDHWHPQRPPWRSVPLEQGSGHSGLQWLGSYSGSDVP